MLIAQEGTRARTRSQRGGVRGVGGGFLLNAFLRDGDGVYRTYSTTCRDVDRLLFVNNIQDHTVYGRQEDWEDSPREPAFAE